MVLQQSRTIERLEARLEEQQKQIIKVCIRLLLFALRLPNLPLLLSPTATCRSSAATR